MKEIISATNAPAALGPYSHAVAMEGIVFTSGQLGIDPATGKLAEGVAAQAEQALKNLEAVLKAAGASMADVVNHRVREGSCGFRHRKHHLRPAFRR